MFQEKSHSKVPGNNPEQSHGLLLIGTVGLMKSSAGGENEVEHVVIKRIRKEGSILK